MGNGARGHMQAVICVLEREGAVHGEVLRRWTYPYGGMFWDGHDGTRVHRVRGRATHLHRGYRHP